MGAEVARRYVRSRHKRICLERADVKRKILLRVSSTDPPEPTRRQKLAITTNDPAVLDQAVNGSGTVTVSNCSYACLIIWTMSP